MAITTPNVSGNPIMTAVVKVMLNLDRHNHSSSSNKKMSLFLVRIFCCIVVLGITLYAYIDKQNQLTELRIAIPLLIKELRELREENVRLQYEIDRFESPVHLMELARKPEFASFKYPYVSEIVILPEGQLLLPENKNSDFDQKN